MPAPRQSPRQVGGGTVFRSGSQYRRGLVRDINADNNGCTMIDMGLGEDFDVGMETPEGRKPQIGDLWLCSMETGLWQPIALLDAMAKYVAIDRSLDLMLELDRRGTISWDPFDTTLAAPEMPHGGYIGEHRLMEIQPDTRFIPLDGRIVLRNRYRALWDLVSAGIPGNGYTTGNGTTTFGVPNYWPPTPGTAIWTVVAE